jgi:molybdopterin-guanine dinucleotide biosynthesis protein A
MGFDAIVLAGGTSARMGVDKLRENLDGRSLLDRVLDACAAARRTVVVGPHRVTEREVVWAREEPPGTGPVAALAAGLAETSEPLVAVLAGDLGLMTPGALARLLAQAEGRDGVVYRDASGRDQYLAAVYARRPLEERLGRLGDLEGMSMRMLVAGLDLAYVTGGDEVTDIDTPIDLDAARSRAASRGRSDG